MILITLTAQGGLHEGLQNMIATPFLCVYAILCLRNDPKHFIKMISNILIVLFLLNLTIFNPYIMQYKIAEYHIIFLGHVQVQRSLGDWEFCVEHWNSGVERKRHCCWNFFLSYNVDPVMLPVLF